MSSKSEKYAVLVETEHTNFHAVVEAFSHKDAALKFLKASTSSLITNGTYDVRVVKMGEMVIVPCTVSKGVQLAR